MQTGHSPNKAPKEIKPDQSVSSLENYGRFEFDLKDLEDQKGIKEETIDSDIKTPPKKSKTEINKLLDEYFGSKSVTKASE